MLVESADRTLRILESLRPDGDMSLGELAEALALPKSSVHRLLAVLLEHGFVEQDPPTRRYRLGIRLFELGSAAIASRGVHAVAHGVLRDLSAQTRATSHLAVLSERAAVYVDKIDGPGSFPMSSRIGGRAPLHATSIGKVLAAWGGKDLEDRIVRGGLRRHTPNTITRAAALRAELATVRERGYALDLEEYEPGLRCIAAPVFDQAGAVDAAIGIASARDDFAKRTAADLIAAVTRAAGRLSSGLGHDPHSRTAFREAERHVDRPRARR